MKKFYSLIIAIIVTTTVFAQAPEKMSYQAVIRDASNALVTDQSIGLKISILQGSINGTAIYVETQNPTTNNSGLISLEIGSGTNVSGLFSNIPWGSDNFFIKTETDPEGGTNYTITGTSQLMSVPYALHAKTSENITGTITESQISDLTHTVDTDTNLSETQVDGFVANNGYITAEVDGSTTNEIQDLQLSGNNLTITSNGTATTIDLSPYLDDTDTKLTETQVDAFVANNGYITAEVDGSVTNEIELPSQTGQSGKILVTNGSSPSWQTPVTIQNNFRTITANTTLTVTDYTVIISGPQTVTLPLNPPDGMKLIICGNDQVATIISNGKNILIADATITTLRFSDVSTNVYTFIFSTTLDSWLASY